MVEEGFVQIRDILGGEHTGKTVSIRGWIYRTRSGGSIVFSVLRDGTGILQATIKKGNLPDEEFEWAAKTLVESSVSISGLVAEDKRAPGGYELKASSYKMIHLAEVFPITKDQSEEFLLDKRHLWVRSQKLTSVMKVKATILGAAREWFEKEGWIETTPPILSASAGEGGSTVFALKYFGDTAFLAQTAQLHLEALIFSLDKVYSLTPSFRAEKSRTPRHLTEFWHLEGEAAWVDNEGNMDVHEQLISHICQRAAEKNGPELADLGRDPAALAKIKPPFQRITYTEAVDILHSKGMDFTWGDDFGTVEERILTEDMEIPMFVKNYPKSAKAAFYMKENPEDKNTVLCSDLLAPEGYGEIIGASEREVDNGILISRLQEQGADIKNYEWYLDLRRYGSVPHSGFGIGIERIVRWVCKLDHIRDAVPFPRTPSRFYP
ncbi:MAG: asparagine--tRNA ligase [Candidatus Thermoplasmatota archaeon]|nr:asparagine--tRNA ligase [Candidatus Thermoplasmatota archaeon]